MTVCGAHEANQASLLAGVTAGDASPLRLAAWLKWRLTGGHRRGSLLVVFVDEVEVELLAVQDVQIATAVTHAAVTA